MPQVSGWRAVVKRSRRRGRAVLNRLLTRIAGTRAPKRRPLAQDTNTILVVRINKRLGNILFLTPMLHALNRALPHAAVDVLIRDPKQVPLLDDLPGVRNVYVQPRSLRRLLAVLGTLRRQHYDLAIDPSGNSTGNRAAVALAGARQRLGFAGPNQWLRLTHAAPESASLHQAQQSVDLLSGGIEGIDFGHWPYLVVNPRETARVEAGRYWTQALGSVVDGPVIGFFSNATGGKRLDDDWWQTWLNMVRERAPAAEILQIHPPGAPQRLEQGLPGVEIAALDVLAALLGRLSTFVAADSGPMHLAAAVGVPTIGLFKATSAAAYAPLGPGCVALDGADLTPEQAACEAAARAG